MLENYLSASFRHFYTRLEKKMSFNGLSQIENLIEDIHDTA